MVTCLHKAKNRRYISNERFESLYNIVYNLINMLVAFRDKIK
ncbi:MAG: hypothetical protein WBA23_01455 [Tunicatimonas sp.]